MTKQSRLEDRINVFRLNRKLTPYRSAVRITLIYLIFGALWIIISDRLLAFLVRDPQLYIELSTVKGWIYVAITSAFIYVLVVSTLDLYVEAKRKVESVNEDLKNQLIKTSQSEQRFELAVKGSFDSIWEHDIASDSLTMSDPLLRNLGYTAQDLVISKIDDWLAIVHPGDVDMVRQRIDHFLANPHEDFEFSYRVIKKDKSFAWIRTHGTALIGENGEISKIAGSHSDITLAHEYQEKLTHLAYFDTLTGLMNWHGFSNLIEQRINTLPDKPFSLLYLDIDDFKNINDVHGYQVGDRLLKEISSELTKLIREPDVIANLGGDGFGFLMETVQNSELLSKINTIYETFRIIHNLEGLLLNVYASIGIAQYPKDSQNFAGLMQSADEAMYQAKSEGKNTFVFFNDEFHSQRIKSIAMSLDLRKAVEKDELYLMYQPVYRLNDLEFSSIETLIRWNRRGQENIPPDVFIPLAETSGLITEIELWVFKHAFMQIVAWRSDHKKRIPVAINLSSYGITNDGFVQHIVALLKEYGIRDGEVEIEITETGLIEGYDIAVKNLMILRANGVRILLDDFGKGYSSLTHLVKLPIDILKIDIGFTSRIHTSMEIDSVITTIVNLAHSINLEVIAEGIEQAYQIEFLKSINADFGQGYHLHRPTMPDVIKNLF
jgi:diguanylate cyclase (GGDEF)-like protein/PAS domain S-box-containing protein